MTALENLTDVTITSLTAGDILQSPDGATWVNIQPGSGSGIQPFNVNTSFTNVAETRSAAIDMNGHIINNAQFQSYSETVQAVTASSTTGFDLSLGGVINMSQNTPITTLNITNIPSGSVSSSFTLIRRKDSSATPQGITWPASFKWESGVAPTLSSNSSAIDTLEFVTIDNGTTWFGYQSGLNMS